MAHNLFLYDLAIVAVMKNEAPYLKEWLDYHLLAGVDHFYIYDNDSTDNQAEVAAPYIAKGLVDYIPFSGEAVQYLVYNDAINRFKFQCRYMAFIDADEFIFPKNNQSIVEVVDDIFISVHRTASLIVHWQHFGSNGQEKADYSKGVLERFTKRAEVNWTYLGGGNTSFKPIFNPRLIDFVPNCHRLAYLADYHAINERGVKIPDASRFNDISTKKIVINHYHCKSWEEFSKRKLRGSVMFFNGNKYNRTRFDNYDKNDVFDDGILKYRDERAKCYQSHEFAQDKQRLFDGTKSILTNCPPGKRNMETFLTCAANGYYLHSRGLIELALRNIFALLYNKPDLSDALLFVKNLTLVLKVSRDFDYDFKHFAIDVIPQLMTHMHSVSNWQQYSNLDFIRRLLLSKG